MAYGPTSLRCLRFASLALTSTLIVACSGGGGDSGGGGGGGSTATVTISGRITFDRVPFKAPPLQGLNFAGIIESPAREVVVEAVQPGNVFGGEVIVATTTTNTAGDYALQVPANTTVLIRAKAQMLKTGAAPNWNFRVLNNTNNDALYALDGAATSSGTASSVRNLRATTGFGTTSYTGTRAAAPFAILDTIYQVRTLILSARADTAFPALELYWSGTNRGVSPFCPDNGDIVSSLYTVFSANSPNDDCSTPTPGRDGIYILGSFPADSDEFDQHVIAHEAGHYFEDRFSRSDSIGGEHSLQDRLDLRVAFGEGWGDAFGAMVLNDPVYRDSFSGTTQDSSFNLESGVATTPGWSSEFSTLKILWDLFDPANEPGVDDVALGFTPIHNVMTGTQAGTDALTGIFPFARALKAGNPGATTAINTLLANQGIATSSDDFASGEMTYAGPNVVPIYTSVQSGTPVDVCGSAVYGEYNKASNRRFLAFQSGSARPITITATVASGAQDADPDIIVWRRGGIVAVGEDVASQEVLPVTVQTGTYIIEVYDFNHVDSDGATGNSTTCMTVSIAG